MNLLMRMGLVSSLVAGLCASLRLDADLWQEIAEHGADVVQHRSLRFCIVARDMDSRIAIVTPTYAMTELGHIDCFFLRRAVKSWVRNRYQRGVIANATKLR